MATLEFEQIKTRHILFKIRLQSVIKGSAIDDTSLGSHHLATIEKWIHEKAERYIHIAAVSELERVHAKIQECAEKLIALYKNSITEEIGEVLSQLEVLTEKFSELLETVEKEIKAQDAEASGIPAIPKEITIGYQELLELHELIQKQDELVRAHKINEQRARDEVRGTENKFRSTVMQAPVGITILRGPEFVIELANETYLQIVDRHENDFVGKRLFDALPEVKTAVEPLLNEVLQTGRSYYGNEFAVNLKRFGKIEKSYFSFVYQALREHDGRVSGIIVVATDVTTQVEARYALQQSENQFRNLAAQSPIAMAILKGKDWIIDMANESLLKKLWRRKAHEVYGKKLMDVFPELKDQQFPAQLNEVYNSGRAYKENEAVAYIDGKDGTRKFYLDFEYAPLFETDGTVSGIMVTVSDVTEKAESRQQIKDAVERLSLATEGTQLATWDLNLVTFDIIYSKRLLKIFGYDEDKILTHPEMRSHVHPDDIHSVVEKAFEKALLTGIYYYEARIIRPDKSVHWIRTHGKVIFDIHHAPVRMLGTMMDVTEEKRYKQAIEESERKFRMLADSMPQLIWTADAQGNLNYFSQSVFDYAGLTNEQLMNEGWLQIVHPDDREENVRLWKDALATGKPFIFEHRFRRHDGVYRWQLSRATPQVDADEVIQMWVGTSTDINDRKLFIDELELQVQQRTRELHLTNENLIRSNYELAQFAYVASHDLQEPLRKIQTFVSRIAESKESSFSAKDKDYFNRVQNASGRMQQLIQDLLSFSRTNASESHFEIADVNAILQNVLEQLAETMDQKGAVINFSSLPTVRIIPYQFEQLFTNIISNALKFSNPEIAPRIDIACSTVSSETIQHSVGETTSTYYQIAITDNGIGFDPQFSERIFQVFQRLHGRNEYEGTGIGLAICKKIVENHHGFIKAIGEPGKGATFFIYIPATA
ncbi:PAS domain S-box protein [Ohtaekwangia koreensis]|nr:PAS domain S-box protein [Ohtaekwangia koreensis]